MVSDIFNWLFLNQSTEIIPYQLMNDGEDSPEEIRGHAEAWVADNQTEFDGWGETALSAQ